MLRRSFLFAAAPVKLEYAEVVRYLDSMPGWKTEPEPARPTIQKTFLFKDFETAWGFMNACVPHINQADHHPEWFNVYNRVEVTLATHDCGGVSEKDLTLAKHMDSLANDFPQQQKQ